jgi:hypothetical protein
LVREISHKRSLQWTNHKISINLFNLPSFSFPPHFTSGTLEHAFQDIRAKAEEAGALPGIEMLQARDKDKVILFAMPGTTERLPTGDFPPPSPMPKTPEE